MRVRKNSGKYQEFSKEKIEVAIMKAAEDVDQEIPKATVKRIAADIEEAINNRDSKTIHVDEISKMVENKLMNTSYKDVARSYIEHRHMQDIIREVNTTDKSILDLLKNDDEYWKRENSNKDSRLVTTQRDYIAGIVATDLSKRYFLSKDIVKAHEEGIIHFHDIDYFLPGAGRNNCCLVNLEDMLTNGTVINNIKIETPHKFITAATIATQIITAVSSSQYGGVTVSMTHLAPFVRKSYYKYYEEYIRRGLDEKKAAEFADLDTKREVRDGVQTINYQVNSMSSTNGQAPFITIDLDISETDEYKKELALIIEEFLIQRIEGMKNEKGYTVTIAFPKLVYVLSEENITEDSPYWYLTVLSAKCTAKRMVPDYVSKKKMQEYKINRFGNGDWYPPMGCRSFLTPYRTKENVAKALNYDPNKPKYYGRFNAGVVTISLPDLALSSKRNFDKFWQLFEERTELCHKALKCRLDSLKGMRACNAPILWQYGALARVYVQPRDQCMSAT